MIPARKATPDSEAVGSSEDEKPWPSSMSFGKFPMTEGGMPGLPGGIWSTGRGSFKMDKKQLDAARANIRLGAPNPVHATLRATPSPSASEGAATLPFAIPLQPTTKTGRSLSHSQGQRESLQNSAAHQTSGGHAAVLPLGLLAEEEADTESESELGSKLTHTVSHPPIGSLMRTATLPPTFNQHRGSSNGSDYQGRASHSPNQPGLLRGRTFEAAFADLSLDHAGRRAQWQSSLGWDDVPNVNESRRHSLADIPTRRGSLAAGEPSHLSRAFTHDPQEIDEHPHSFGGYVPDRDIETNMTRAQDTADSLNIPAMYRVPYVALSPSERREIEMRREQQPASPSLQYGQGAARPRKQLFIVSFKCSRVDVFYLLDNTGLTVREGDLVIVEADRGQDLGTVQHAKVTPEAARLLKKKYSEEQYKWLMMYSRNKDGANNPNAQVHGENSVGPMLHDAPATMQGTIPRDNFNNLKPKAIKRLANDHEIKMLAEKEGNEAKAKRTCQHKVQHLRLQMEILDAEWQWDFQKLIFYYYADHYINFKDLITELYRIYKTRIWLSAINPASFSQHAMGQPPSGIGPGAMSPYNPYAMNSAYTMAYGEDRDPYGAQMPYRIPYDTYTPNYPAIPGVANSFAPPAQYNQGQNYMFFAPAGPQDAAFAAQRAFPPPVEEGLPTTDPLINRTGAIRDYNFFYDNSGNEEHYNLGSKEGAELTMPDPAKMLAQHQEQQQQVRGLYGAEHGSYPAPGMPFMPGHANPFAVQQQQQQPGADRRKQQPPIGTRPIPHGNEVAAQTFGGQHRQPMNSTHPSRLVFGSHIPSNDNSGQDQGHANPASFTPVFEAQAQAQAQKSRQQLKKDADETKAGMIDRYISQLPDPAGMKPENMTHDR